MEHYENSCLGYWFSHLHSPSGNTTAGMLQHRWVNLRIVALEENTKLHQIPVARVRSLFIFLRREVRQCSFFPVNFFFNCSVRRHLGILVSCWKRRIAQAFNPHVGLFHRNAVQAGSVMSWSISVQL